MRSVPRLRVLVTGAALAWALALAWLVWLAPDTTTVHLTARYLLLSVGPLAAVAAIVAYTYRNRAREPKSTVDMPDITGPIPIQYGPETRR